MKEIYKDIPGYKELYQISNLGNVKSLDRYIKCPLNGRRLVKSKILTKTNNGNGYLKVHLSKLGQVKKKYVHQLVAMAFLNHKPNGHKLVVDHINNNPLDNILSNLQVVSHRQNSSKDKKGGSSKYIGVSFNDKYKKFESRIWIDGKNKHLGLFEEEVKASEAYQIALNEISNG